MIVVFLALGTTDLLFALDSIPAIFGLTREPFIVFTANVFALMGLRQLYFLLGGLLKRLVYLSLGLAVILAFIGVKLVLEAVHENSLPFINGGEPIHAVPSIPIWLSLTVILGVLVVATVASLLKTRGALPAAEQPATAAAESPVGGSASVARHAADRPRAPAHPRRPGRVPGRADGRGRRQPARPGRRRVPQPAVGGADRRVGVRPAADLGHLDSAPAFSPDGRWLAYLSAEPGGRPQLWLLPTAGGAPRRLTDHHLGAGPPVWSPDSRRLAYVARVPEQGRYGTVEGVGPGAEPPRLITTLKYRRDDVGFLTDRPSQVFVLDLPADFEDDTASAAGADPGDHRRPPTASTSRGVRTAASSRSSPRGTRGPTSTWCATSTRSAPDGTGLRRVTDSRGDCALPAYDPAGALYVTAVPDLGPDGLDFVARQAVPCRVDAAGGALEPLLDPAVHHRGDETPATVLADGGVLVGVQREGAVELLRVPLDGGAPETLVDGPFTVRGFARRRGRRRRRRRARPVRGRADRAHPGTAAAADRVRPPAGRDRPGAPDARADGDVPGRLSGARVGDHPARAGSAPGAAGHPRRPVRPVRLDPVRRDPGLRLGRLRGRAVQPARVLRLRRGARAGDQGRVRRARRRRRAGLPRRRAHRSGARRRPGRGHGRLVRRLPDHVPDRPHRRGSSRRSASGRSSTRSASWGPPTSAGTSPTSTSAPTRSGWPRRAP